MPLLQLTEEWEVMSVASHTTVVPAYFYPSATTQDITSFTRWYLQIV